MAFLAGHFQIAFYVALAAGLWWLWKLGEVWRAEGKTYAVLRVVVPFAAFAVIAGLIAAPQVLPTVELAQNSHRVRDVTPEGYSHFVANAVQPYRLITAFIPDFFGNPSRGDYFLGSAADYMEYGLYIGILPLVLALIALTRIRAQKHIVFFATLALLAILTATGTPVNYLFYYLIPGFTALGGPNRILLVYFLGIAGLAGFGVDYFAAHGADRVQRGEKGVRAGMIDALAAWACVVALCCLALALTAAFAVSAPWHLRERILLSAALPTGLLWLVSGLPLVGRSVGLFSARKFSVIAGCVMVADFFAFGINYNPTCERSKVYPETELTTKLKQIAGNYRVAPINPRWNLYKTPDAILPPNAAMVYGLYDVQGYDSLYTKSYKDLSSDIQGEDSSPPENGNMVLIRRYTSDLPLFAGYVIRREPFADGGRWWFRHVRRVGDVYVYAHPAATVAQVSANRQILNVLWAFHGDFEYDGPNRVLRRVPGPERWRGPIGRGTVNYPGPERWRGPIGRGTVNYPGWVATCRGRRLRIAADAIGLRLQTAEYVTGPTTVTFCFEPFSFRFGVFLGCVGVGAITCVGFYRALRWRRNHR